MENKKFDLSKDKQKLLEHEEFMREVLELRKPVEESPKPKSSLLRFLETNGGTAVITILLTGLVGGIGTPIVSYFIQKQMKDREFEQAKNKVRWDLEVIAYKEYLDRQKEIISQAYELVGSCIYASDNLISITKPEFAPHRRIRVEEQRTSIRVKYNETRERWQREREKVGLLMSYYHGGKSEVSEAWNNLQDSVTKHMDCARRWYVDYESKPTKAKDVCGTEKKVLEEQLNGLKVSLDEARRYFWQELGTMNSK
jgi:hypothetical protein